MTHYLKKKTGRNDMLNTIDPIVRYVRTELLIKYFEYNRIPSKNIDWTKSPDLLRLDIKKAVEKLGAEKGANVLNDFYRIKRMTKHDDSIDNRTSYSKVFFRFLQDPLKFKEEEDIIVNNDPYGRLLVKLLNNGKVVSVFLITSCFILNLAQILGDESGHKYVVLNLLNYILGVLTVFFATRKENDNESIF
jgi:hypothetical protein